jgi:hypothetical protein
VIYLLSFRDPHGAVVPGQLEEWPSGKPIRQPGSMLSSGQVTFLVHGFNVDRSSGVGSLTRLAQLLADDHFEGEIVCVLWPGDSPIGPLSYPFTEGKQAEDTARELVRFIDAHLGAATRMNFLAHSLGSRVVLETLNNLHREAAGDRNVYPVSQVCLMAAAVDDYCLAPPRKYKAATERATRLVALCSREDLVLRAIYPLGDLLQSFIYFWKESSGLALGYHGPRPLTEKRVRGRRRVKITRHQVAGNVSPVQIDANEDVGHGDYLPPADASDPLNDKQQHARQFALRALGGSGGLAYPPHEGTPV